jgi:alpha-galactosidase
MHAAISETAVLAAAQSFIALGLREAGYEYVNIDVCLSNRSLRLILTTP